MPMLLYYLASFFRWKIDTLNHNEKRCGRWLPVMYNLTFVVVSVGFISVAHLKTTRLVKVLYKLISNKQDKTTYQ